MTAGALFAAVYASPTDDAPRSVLADFLQERGDPRGEFIALQLARAPRGRATPRERALFAAHHTAWLGPLANELRAHPTFERGFLARCAVKATTRGATLGLPEMATVVDLDVGSWGFFPYVVAVMPALRRLRGLDGTASVAGLEPLLAPPWGDQLEHITIDLGDADPEPWRARLATVPARLRVELR